MRKPTKREVDSAFEDVIYERAVKLIQRLLTRQQVLRVMRRLNVLFIGSERRPPRKVP